MSLACRRRAASPNAVECLETSRSIEEANNLLAVKQAIRDTRSRLKQPRHSRRYRISFHVKFRLTTRWSSVFFVQIAEDQLEFTSDMKKLFTLSMLISFAMICSCQKQDSTAEPQLAQRKTELDARQNALDEREKELALRETCAYNEHRPPRSPPCDHARNPDAAQARAERETSLQQLPPDVQMLIPNVAQVQTQRDKRMQRRLEELRRRRSGGAAPPAGVSCGGGYVGSISCGGGYFPKSVAHAAVNPRH